MFGWLRSHWKGIATLAVAAVAFTAVTVLTGGLGAPLLLSLAAGGFASGVAGYVTGELLDGRTPTVRQALVQGTIAAAITVGTFGVGRVLAPYASRALAPVVNRIPAVVRREVPSLVTRTATNSAVGAAFGTGIKVAENALLGRPLTEGTRDAAIFGALSGALVEPSQRLVGAVRNRVVPPLRIDPVTQATMDRYGLTPDSILYRVTNPRHIVDGQIAGNPNSMALVRDPYNVRPHPLADQIPGLSPVPRQLYANELGPSLNVAVKDPSIYADPGMVRIGVRLGDILAQGGRIYPDAGAVAQGLQPLIVTFPGRIPVVTQSVVGGTATTDTTAANLPPAPSNTKGMANALGGNN